MPRERPIIDANYIVDQYRSGRSSGDIAREIGVSVSTILSRIKAAGVAIRSRTIALDDDAICNAYASGDNLKMIAKSVGVGQTLVRRILARRGVAMRPSAYAPRTSIPIDKARALYEAGVGVGGVAKRFGVSHSAILRIFRDAGIPTRNRSEQQRARMARTPAEDRRRLAANAHAAVRGRTVPIETKILLAKVCQDRMARAVSRYETTLAEMLRHRGCVVTQQLAVGPYNCDLAIDPVAVEVWAGHWHWSGHHRARTDERFRHIMNAGWHIIAVAIWKSFPLTDAVADYLVSEIDALRGNPTARRQYRVVWGAGEFATAGGLDDDEISIEPPFRNARDPVTGRYYRVAR